MESPFSLIEATYLERLITLVDAWNDIRIKVPNVKVGTQKLVLSAFVAAMHCGEDMIVVQLQEMSGQYSKQ